MVKIYVISYSRKDARHAASRAAAGGCLVLQSTDMVSACRSAEKVLARDSAISGIREAQYIFAADDIQEEGREQSKEIFSHVAT